MKVGRISWKWVEMDGPVQTEWSQLEIGGSGWMGVYVWKGASGWL
jgi:hypothetical protein